MIHFVIGTKAQFVKMAPVMHVLQEEHLPYRLLDLSQHGGLTGRILDDFGLTPVLTRLNAERTSVTTYKEAAHWLAGGLRHLTLGRGAVRRRLFGDREGIALLHGDTASTLLGLYLARAAKLRTGLVEAGLTSGNLLDPFPEEWIRRHVSKRCDFLFAPGPEAEDWLKRNTPKSQIMNTEYNTGRDALSLIRRRGRPSTEELRTLPASYGVATLHRLETLSNRERLARAIEHVVAIARAAGPLLFFLHPPTANALQRYRLLHTLQSSADVRLHSLLPYPEFVAVLAGARFVLTDGGSIQEESAYLAKPCVILRSRTERSEGLRHNAALTTWDVASDLSHLRAAPAPAATSHDADLAASRRIVESIKAYAA